MIRVTKASAPQPLTPQAATAEAHAPRARAPWQVGHHSEKPEHCPKEQPLIRARESPRAAMQTQRSQNKQINWKKEESASAPESRLVGKPQA